MYSKYTKEHCHNLKFCILNLINYITNMYKIEEDTRFRIRDN